MQPNPDPLIHRQRKANERISQALGTTCRTLVQENRVRLYAVLKGGPRPRHYVRVHWNPARPDAAVLVAAIGFAVSEYGQNWRTETGPRWPSTLSRDRLHRAAAALENGDGVLLSSLGFSMEMWTFVDGARLRRNEGPGWQVVDASVRLDLGEEIPREKNHPPWRTDASNDAE